MVYGEAPATATTAVRLASSPLSATSIGQLLFQPSRYFSEPQFLGKTPELWLVAWLTGISFTIGRLNKNLIKAELGAQDGGGLTALLGESWVTLWVFVLSFGVLNALILFYLGGWWYRKRLEWSGVSAPDRDLSRQVYVYQNLVQSAPALVLLAVQTLVFRSYSEAWEAEEYWSSIILVFVFWSCAASYKAARSAFSAGRWKARLWFFILPLTVYVVALGMLGTLYALLGK